VFSHAQNISKSYSPQNRKQKLTTKKSKKIPQIDVPLELSQTNRRMFYKKRHVHIWKHYCHATYASYL